VLAFSGALACGDSVEAELRTVASNVESVVIADCGHYPAEEHPEALLAAFEAFFAPYAR
jgi:pimeloyl-ACP methyl ester carboxylesterase